jgi:hypothetical protein
LFSNFREEDPSLHFNWLKFRVYQPISKETKKQKEEGRKKEKRRRRRQGRGR